MGTRTGAGGSAGLAPVEVPSLTTTPPQPTAGHRASVGGGGGVVVGQDGDAGESIEEGLAAPRLQRKDESLHVWDVSSLGADASEVTAYGGQGRWRSSCCCRL